MWPFGHTTASPETEPELTPALSKRLDELEDENRRLEKALRALELDWSEWFNKFRLLYARLSKRIKDEETRAQDDVQPTNAPNGDHIDARHELIHQRLSRPKGPSRNY